jgi:hypothetical protein
VNGTSATTSSNVHKISLCWIEIWIIQFGCSVLCR